MEKNDCAVCDVFQRFGAEDFGVELFALIGHTVNRGTLPDALGGKATEVLSERRGATMLP